MKLLCVVIGSALGGLLFTEPLQVSASEWLWILLGSVCISWSAGVYLARDRLLVPAWFYGFLSFVLFWALTLWDIMVDHLTFFISRGEVCIDMVDRQIDARIDEMMLGSLIALMIGYFSRPLHARIRLRKRRHLK